MNSIPGFKVVLNFCFFFFFQTPVLFFFTIKMLLTTDISCQEMEDIRLYSSSVFHNSLWGFFLVAVNPVALNDNNEITVCVAVFLKLFPKCRNFPPETRKLFPV